MNISREDFEKMSYSDIEEWIIKNTGWEYSLSAKRWANIREGTLSEERPVRWDDLNSVSAIFPEGWEWRRYTWARKKVWQARKEGMLFADGITIEDTGLERGDRLRLAAYCIEFDMNERTRLLGG